MKATKLPEVVGYQRVLSNRNAKAASRQVLFRLLAILIATILLSWPMLLNRQPFLLSDTTNYIRGADAAADRLFGTSTDWSNRFVAEYVKTNVVKRMDNDTKQIERPITLAGRSIYYGAFIYVSERLVDLRFASFIQAFLSALCLLLTLDRFRSRLVIRDLLLCAAVLSTMSSLAYFCSYLMPDIFTGLSLLGVGHLVCRGPRISTIETMFWLTILCLGCLFHSSNILILVILLLLISLGWLRTRFFSLRGLGLVFAAVLVGVAGEAGFYAAVNHFTGDPPVRPPFLTARLIADGPGRSYLRETCPGSGFALCRHLNSLSAYSDDFLWSESASNGVFSVVPLSERRQISAEQSRFAVSVIETHPVAVFHSFLVAITEQARKWHLPEFNLSPAEASELAAKLPPRVLNEQRNTLAFRGAMPVKVTEALSLPTALFALFGLAWLWLRRKIDCGANVFIATLLAGFIVDVIVCGGLSTPHDRYLMRVSWLIPFALFVARGVVKVRPRTVTWNGADCEMIADDASPLKRANLYFSRTRALLAD